MGLLKFSAALFQLPVVDTLVEPAALTRGGPLSGVTRNMKVTGPPFTVFTCM